MRETAHAGICRINIDRQAPPDPASGGRRVFEGATADPSRWLRWRVGAAVCQEESVAEALPRSMTLRKPHAAITLSPVGVSHAGGLSVTAMACLV